ncbi:hypothetical protein EEB12_28860 [Rhodococcus sp. WS1]|uniref:hypothetical protein n=1 Tax=unclassified Rhodococcus (in: high G+C Gram-positive bacteria) TaxID=192944 RepID=UPI0011415F56|nr:MULTISPECIES: hypothetical protein [unclassified Rhodococcus (in: high G+C Gram-positive bacteria)]ROZ52856.1 hypothetical protein EEB12_28860 [Rhodococcus sp. WS1]TQC35947.1 hypothetical protein EEB16_20485 [Rhodococcus sp. WS7]
MSHQIASDLEGRTWAILSVGNAMKARLLTGTAPRAAMELDEVVNTYGPLILSPTHEGNGYVPVLDTADLVASDPETASVEQIRVVASVLRGILDRHGNAPVGDR